MPLRLFGALFVSVAVATISSQVVPSVKGASQADNSSWDPKNLKVLPKKISLGELNKLMVGYTRELGVPCGYCHEQDPDTKEINYASDANPVKETARIMIGMTSDINKKYLSQLGDRRYAEPLSCGNCHQGRSSPPAFQPK